MQEHILAANKSEVYFGHSAELKLRILDDTDRNTIIIEFGQGRPYTPEGVLPSVTTYAMLEVEELKDLASVENADWYWYQPLKEEQHFVPVRFSKSQLGIEPQSGKVIAGTVNVNGRVFKRDKLIYQRFMGQMQAA